MHVPRLPLNKCDKNNKFMQNISSGINKLLVIYFSFYINCFFFACAFLYIFWSGSGFDVKMCLKYLQTTKATKQQKIFTAVIKFMHIAIIVFENILVFLKWRARHQKLKGKEKIEITRRPLTSRHRRQTTVIIKFP